jgi:ATP-dependent Clp protease adapter protein ClpS
MSQDEASAAATENQGGVATAPAPPRTRRLPLFRVLLHNDDKNSFQDVIETITLLTPLRHADAVTKTIEAHEIGVSLLLVTYRERAELYVEQFQSRQLTVSIEPAE